MRVIKKLNLKDTKIQKRKKQTYGDQKWKNINLIGPKITLVLKILHLVSLFKKY